MAQQAPGAINTIDACTSFFSRINVVARVYWWDASRPVVEDAWMRLAAVLVLQVVRSKASAWLSWTTRAQLGAWGTFLKFDGDGRSKSKTGSAVAQAVSLNLLAVILNVVVDKMYQRVLLSLRMRWSKRLTAHLLQHYLKLNSRAGSEVSGLDRAEQHLAYDVDKFVDLFVSLSSDALQGAIHVIVYAQLLRSIAAPLSSTAVIAALIGTAITTHIGRELPLLHRTERANDSDFRYALHRTRANAESILFCKGEAREREELVNRHARTQAASWQWKNAKDNTVAFSSQFMKLVASVPTMLLMTMTSHDEEAAYEHEYSHSNGHGHSHGNDKDYSQSVNESDRVGQVLQASDAFNEVLFHMLFVAEKLGDFSRLHNVTEQLCTSLAQIQLEEKNNKFISLPNVHKSSRRKTSSSTSSSPPPSNASSTSSSSSIFIPTSLFLSDPLVYRIKLIRVHLPSVLSVGTPWLRMSDLNIITPIPTDIGDKNKNIPSQSQSQPEAAVLVQDLNIKLLVPCTEDGIARAPLARGLLVVGASGCGKTSLLRGLAGIWSHGSGSIDCPEEVMFIPQVPYLALGSLRDQLLYPARAVDTKSTKHDQGACVCDREMEEALRLVSLDYVLTRDPRGLDAHARWSEELSVGEQQRLAFARILVAKPRFVVLDEATSACDLASERQLYTLLSRRCVAWVSVGHRPSLEPFHTQRLTLFGGKRGSNGIDSNGSGGWTVEPVHASVHVATG